MVLLYIVLLYMVLLYIVLLYMVLLYMVLLYMVLLYMYFSRLFMLQNALLQQEWRVTDIHHRLIKYLRPHISHPYKNVRDRLGRLAFVCFL